MLFRFFILLFVISFTGAVNPSFAQKSFDEVSKEKYPDTLTYVDVENMAWLMGARSLNNGEDINNYLMINECEMYREFRANEFEWKEIQDIAANSISLRMGRLEKSLTFVQPLEVYQYDFNRKGFPISENYVMQGHNEFHLMPEVSGKSECTREISSWSYPSSVLFISKRPIFLSFIPVDFDLGREFSENVKPEFDRANDYVRTMYIKFTISFKAYNKLKIKPSLGGRVLEYLGTIEEYEVFLDRYLSRSVLRKDLRSTKRPR